MKPQYIRKIDRLKSRPDFYIPVGKYGNKKIRLRVLTENDLEDKFVISNLSRWRDKHSYWFGGKFKITHARTKKWLRDLVLKKADRILFMIEDQNGKGYGHLGFNRYIPADNSCELDNVIRGIEDIHGLMTDCVKVIVAWGFKNLDFDKLHLITFKDNEKAVNLYKRSGFRIVGTIPLKQVKHDGEISWKEIARDEKIKPQRFYVRMKFKKV